MAIKYFFVLSFISVLFVSGVVQARCYSYEEAEAERVLRIHSELMVIGLNCQHRAAQIGFNPYQGYMKFTKRHEELLEHYENVLMRYYTHTGDPNPQKSLHNFRTSIANKISQDAAIRPDGFCNVYLDRIALAQQIDVNALRRWALNYPLSQPVCGVN